MNTIADLKYFDGEDWIDLGGGGGGGGGLPVTGQTTSYASGDDGDVQAGIPNAGRFVDNGDGTVSDFVTGLMWQQTTASNRNWQYALDYADGLTLGGHSDWRLPNILELLSIVDYNNSTSPSFYSIFSGAASATWSSSTYAPNTMLVWYVNFFSGSAVNTNKTFNCAVRCVRQI